MTMDASGSMLVICLGVAAGGLVITAATEADSQFGMLALVCGLICSGLLTVFQARQFHSQPHGLYQVEQVELPEYGSGKDMKLTIVSRQDFRRRVYGWSVNAIKGFDYKCTLRGKPCGCIQSDDRFWAGRPDAKAVKCPDGVFKDWSQKKPVAPLKPEIETAPPSL
jgi:hypothetical protein